MSHLPRRHPGNTVCRTRRNDVEQIGRSFALVVNQVPNYSASDFSEPGSYQLAKKLDLSLMRPTNRGKETNGAAQVGPIQFKHDLDRLPKPLTTLDPTTATLNSGIGEQPALHKHRTEKRPVTSTANRAGRCRSQLGNRKRPEKEPGQSWIRSPFQDVVENAGDLSTPLVKLVFDGRLDSITQPQCGLEHLGLKMNLPALHGRCQRLCQAARLNVQIRSLLGGRISLQTMQQARGHPV